MSASRSLSSFLACPRCDKAPLAKIDEHYRCDACKVDYPDIGDIPWLFAEPDASLGEWRNRLQFALTKIRQDIAGLDSELQDKMLRDATRQRLERLRASYDEHHRALQTLLRPLDMQGPAGTFESYLALRTRLPSDQGLNTYYANVHRDWCWGDEENSASLQQITDALGSNTAMGDALVLGAGAGRLAYDLHQLPGTTTSIALDFNPLLAIILKTMADGKSLSLHEFPIAPRASGDDAVLRELKAPHKSKAGFYPVLGDALRPPFAANSFDTVVTPWLIDIVSEDLPILATRINHLLRPGGRWVNFGSLAFAHPRYARRYSAIETLEIVAESGFAAPNVVEARIPYMCSPAGRHGRLETVFTFAARKSADANTPPRYRALPDWIVTGKEPVPLTDAFRSQAMTTQIYTFIMSMIDGKRSIRDMAKMMASKKLMPQDEAVAAIRSFLTRMYDDSQKPTGL